jgi:hypothetical protein
MARKKRRGIRRARTTYKNNRKSRRRYDDEIINQPKRKKDVRTIKNIPEKKADKIIIQATVARTKRISRTRRVDTRPTCQAERKRTRNNYFATMGRIGKGNFKITGKKTRNEKFIKKRCIK